MPQRKFKPRPIPRLSEKDIARFWSKVERRGPDECWPWTAGFRTIRSDYGTFHLQRHDWLASRVAFFISTRIDPAELWVLHSCDNPRCVNPAHLSLGSAKENARQMFERGRSYDRVGEGNPRAKLTARQVKEMRVAYRDGKPMRQLAAFYGIGQTQASRIVRGESWDSLPVQDNSRRIVPSNGRAGELNHCAKLTASQVAMIRKRYSKGNITQSQLGLEFGVTQCHIERIINGKSWRHILMGSGCQASPTNPSNV